MGRPFRAPALLVAVIATWLVARAVVGFDVQHLPHGRGTIYFADRFGSPLGSIAATNVQESAWVPLRDVSPFFVRAIVAAEDARFYGHGAIDPRALLRAAAEYVVDGEARSGGSTIAMQLARSVWNVPGGVRGKIEQIVLAERVALSSSPNAILTAYVNRVPMGGDLYGVEAASRAYFGIPASDLDLAQAALLAAIPNDPTRLSPRSGWEALRDRQRYVLTRMRELGDITAAQQRAAERERVELLPPQAGPIAAQQFLFALYARSPHAGTHVRTTIDLPLQNFVQAQAAAIVGALRREHVTDAAALVVDNRTGDILAYVGSPDYFSDAALGRNDGVIALRQPGSSLKPFTYELALESGAISSTSILLDAPAAYAIPGGKLYQPADYSTRFAGPVRVRYALANSLNVPAVRVLARVGVPALLERLHELGFSKLTHPPAFYGLGLTLGSGEVTLDELVHAYVTMARMGSAIPLRGVLAAPSSEPVQIGDPATWALVTDMLADPYARAQSFGLNSILRLPFPAAVKTGTSSDYRDTWTVGFTRDYTVGVWVGNFDGSAMRAVSGVSGAGPLWNRIMLHLYDRRDDPPPFAPPTGYVRAKICATTGLSPLPGCSAVVMEWVRTGSVLARLQTLRRAGSLGIVFPRSGDVFALAPSGLSDAAQALELRASAARVRWRVNGKALAGDAEGHAYWPLALGTWRITARSGNESASATISVVGALRQGRTGFSVVPEGRSAAEGKRAGARAAQQAPRL